jgi:hypothetical protein
MPEKNHPEEKARPEPYVAAGARALWGIGSAIKTWHNSSDTQHDRYILHKGLEEAWRALGKDLGFTKPVSSSTTGRLREDGSAGERASRGISKAIEAWHKSDKTQEDRDVLLKSLEKAWIEFGKGRFRAVVLPPAQGELLRQGVNPGTGGDTAMDLDSEEEKYLSNLALRAYAAGISLGTSSSGGGVITFAIGATAIEEKEVANTLRLLKKATLSDINSIVEQIENCEHEADVRKPSHGL